MGTAFSSNVKNPFPYPIANNLKSELSPIKVAFNKLESQNPVKKLSGVYLEIVDFKSMFDELSSDPIFINDFNVSSLEKREELNRLLFTRFEGNTLSHVPSCLCGHEKGSPKKGDKCSICHTQILLPTERKIESLIWIRTPDEVESLFNPTAWSILRKALDQSGCSMLDWLTNASYVIPNKHKEATPAIVKFKANIHRYLPDFERGYNYFCRNFEAIINAIADLKIFKQKKEDLKDLLAWVSNFKHLFFTDILPLPPKIAFVTESTPMTTFVDFETASAIAAARIFSEIEFSPMPPSLKVRQQKTVTALNHLADFYELFIKSSLSTKSGWFRKHIFGSRTGFNLRAVISSKSEPHDYRQIDIPWGAAVKIFGIHITKKLMDRGMSPNQAKRHIDEHTLQFSPIIDEIFNEILDEAKRRNHLGVSCLLLRNPSLTRGSIQQLYIGAIIRDPNIVTIRMSVLILSASNADRHLTKLYYELI